MTNESMGPPPGNSPVTVDDFENTSLDEEADIDVVSRAGVPETTASLEDLQSAEQQSVLNVVAQLRKCGIDSMLSLPQIVVCGDQSAGKSSVLEALTEIPFPRNDNLCTRFATEIILRRAPQDSITIRVIPDNDRLLNEKEKIKAFRESIEDFNDLPVLMGKATKLMGLDDKSKAQARAFARDVLSIEIEGPSRPQLTLVDLPGLIQTQTKGATKEDVELVAEITNSYINQDRTICLAVVSATSDYANQGILERVREFDPKGERTLGIITKPDRLDSNSGSENSFIELAKNQDIFFSLGWHVLKNRTFAEGASSFEARNASEKAFFRTSNFSALPKSNVGIIALRDRLSQLLFQHVKKELPRLRTELEEVLVQSENDLKAIGNSRSTSRECKTHLVGLSQEVNGICKAAIDGHYGGEYFAYKSKDPLEEDNKVPIQRLRAIIQSLNSDFSNNMHTRGRKYRIGKRSGSDSQNSGPVPSEKANLGDESSEVDEEQDEELIPSDTIEDPIFLEYSKALKWVGRASARNRGTELPGNFNPQIIGELFWKQSEKWKMMAQDHMENAGSKCSQFLRDLINRKCSKDISTRLWSIKIEDALNARREEASKELDRIMEDVKGHPMTYNSVYANIIRKSRQRIGQSSMVEKPGQMSTISEYERGWGQKDVADAAKGYVAGTETDMTTYNSQEALESLDAIYELTQMTFIDNVNTQVVERHIVRGLEMIFSPVAVDEMTDSEVFGIASEPLSQLREREFLKERVKKLGDGRAILRRVIESAHIESAFV